MCAMAAYSSDGAIPFFGMGTRPGLLQMGLSRSLPRLQSPHASIPHASTLPRVLLRHLLCLPGFTITANAYHPRV